MKGIKPLKFKPWTCARKKIDDGIYFFRYHNTNYDCYMWDSLGIGVPSGTVSDSNPEYDSLFYNQGIPTLYKWNHYCWKWDQLRSPISDKKGVERIIRILYEDI